MIRLDKYLADMGVGTRQEVKKYIRQGKVTVDGVVVKRPEQKVDEDEEDVRVDGKQIGYASLEYYMLNKPAGVVSATKDPREETVVSLIGSRKRKDAGCRRRAARRRPVLRWGLPGTLAITPRTSPFTAA